MRGAFVAVLLVLQCTLHRCFMFPLRGLCIDYRRYGTKGTKKTAHDGTRDLSRVKKQFTSGAEKDRKRTTSSNSPVTPESATSEGPPTSSTQADARRAQKHVSQIPKEVAFFGDPRNPPSVSLASDTKHHESLLRWARHSTVAPRTSEDRLRSVFPKGSMHASAGVHRLTNDVHTQSGASTAQPKISTNEGNKVTTLTQSKDAFSDVNVSGSENISYETIFSAFVAVMDNLEASKAFIDSNMDIVPSVQFLRALTADKLASQSRGNIEHMHYLKRVRNKYILAHDQLFFPLNIEVEKAETRVMTYLAGPELATIASEWDSVEMTLFFTTLLAARHTWDNRVREVLSDIKETMDDTVAYNSQELKKDLMDREFRQPAATAEMYLNASLAVQRDMRHLYEKVLPEVQLLHEVYLLDKDEEVVRYVREDFLPRFHLSEVQLKEKLRLLEAALAAVQGTEYIDLRLSVQSLYSTLCTDSEAENTDYWYTEFMERDTTHFDTYEPDTVPLLLKYEQRLRNTDNAFANFAAEVFNLPTQYSNAFSGNRPKAAQVGDWLSYDPEFEAPLPGTQEERMKQFMQAYVEQNELRKAAESQLDRTAVNMMEEQDAALGQDSIGVVDDVGSVFMHNSDDE